MKEIKDKRFLILGQLDSSWVINYFPLINSFETEEDALVFFEGIIDEKYNWVTLYDRVEGVVIKNYYERN